MSRIPTMQHYLERALENASLVAALSSARSDLPSDLTKFAERQNVQLQDTLHDFAFNGRKLIEAAEREHLPSAAFATRKALACSREDDTEEYDEELLSLKDIFGRIIHSDRFSIDRSQVPAADGNLSSGESAWAFSVASDWDKKGSAIFVFIEFLLAEFLKFEEKLRRDIYRSIRVEK